MDDELIEVPRKSQIRLFNKYFTYPLDLKNLIAGINPLLLTFCLLDYLYHTTRKKIFNPAEHSFEDWITNRFGYSLYRIFFGMYTEKLWGISPKLISSDWAAQRISLINLWDILLRLLGRKSRSPKTYALKFLYPKLGIGRICEKFAERISNNGGEIITNADVQHIERKESTVTRILYEKDGATQEISADFYVNTIPAPELVQKLKPQANARYIDVARQMKFRSVRFMNIIFDAERITNNTWIYVPEPEYIFFRIQETKNWSPFLVPDQSKTALILEIACFEGDQLWNKEEQELFDICLRDLKQMGLINGEIKAVNFFSTRVKNAYPIYELNYQEKVDICLELVKGMQNMISIGRQGLFRYNNMDHSIKMGLLAAEHIEHGNLEAKIFSLALEKEAFEIEKDKRDRE